MASIRHTQKINSTHELKELVKQLESLMNVQESIQIDIDIKGVPLEINNPAPQPISKPLPDIIEIEYGHPLSPQAFSSIQKQLKHFGISEVNIVVDFHCQLCGCKHGIDMAYGTGKPLHLEYGICLDCWTVYPVIYTYKGEVKQ